MDAAINRKRCAVSGSSKGINQRSWKTIVDLSVLASDVLLMAGAAGVAGALFSLVDTVSMPPAL
jgi:hypothetical protein